MKKVNKIASLVEMPTDYDQKIHLSEMKNLAKIIATAMIKEYGHYSCMMEMPDGRKLKTVVVL